MAFSKLNLSSVLFTVLGLKRDTRISLTRDSVCMLAEAKIVAQEAVIPEGKKKELITKVVLEPLLNVDTSHMTALNMYRILVEINPEVRALGRVDYARIIEPTFGDKIFLTLENPDGINEKVLKALPHIFRIYVIS